MQRIITNGIKGYENKRRRCLKDGRKLHRTAADSQGARSRKKLLAKSNWFRQRKKNDDGKQWNSNNHMVKHQELLHGGEPAPNFLMRIVSHHKSALSRQVAEAVRIRRRGGDGAVLNSRGEFNRSYIPRLRVVEEEETEENREARLRSRELKIRELIEQDIAWEKDKVVELGDGALGGPMTSP